MPALDLSPAVFFDIDAFEHRALFEGVDGVWQVLGRLESYLAGFKGRQLKGEVSSGAWIEGDGVYIASSARVEPGAFIQGPVLVGEGAEVRHGAYVRGHVIVGRGAVVGHVTEVKHSIFLDGAKAGHFAYVGDSILGNKVNLGAGTKLANLRFDRQPVRIATPEGRVDTGLKKLGAILGDGCELGCNAVTNPGTLLGRRCMVEPTLNVRGYHPEGTLLSSARP